jgi:hypothetical protein
LFTSRRDGVLSFYFDPKHEISDRPRRARVRDALRPVHGWATSPLLRRPRHGRGECGMVAPRSLDPRAGSAVGPVLRPHDISDGCCPAWSAVPGGLWRSRRRCAVISSRSPRNNAGNHLGAHALPGRIWRAGPHQEQKYPKLCCGLRITLSVGCSPSSQEGDQSDARRYPSIRFCRPPLLGRRLGRRERGDL